MGQGQGAEAAADRGINGIVTDPAATQYGGVNPAATHYGGVSPSPSGTVYPNSTSQTNYPTNMSVPTVYADSGRNTARDAYGSKTSVATMPNGMPAPPAAAYGALQTTMPGGLPVPGNDPVSLAPTLPGGVSVNDAMAPPTMRGGLSSRTQSGVQPPTMPGGLPEQPSYLAASQPPTMPGGVPMPSSPSGHNGVSQPPTMPGGVPIPSYNDKEELPNSRYSPPSGQASRQTSRQGSAAGSAADYFNFGGIYGSLGRRPGERDRQDAEHAVSRRNDSQYGPTYAQSPSRDTPNNYNDPPAGYGGSRSGYVDPQAQKLKEIDRLDVGGIYGSISKTGRKPAVNDGRRLPSPPPPASAPFNGSRHAQPPPHRTAGKLPPHLQSVDNSVEVSHPSKTSGALLLRVHCARRLRNGDTGLFGDVSDPYVSARVGMSVHRTPTIENELNPVWDHGNEFIFPVTGKDGALILEVMNSNVVRDSSLGTINLPLWSFPPGKWERFTKPLKNGEGELEFEVRFDKDVDVNDAAKAMAAAKRSMPRSMPEETGLFYALGAPKEEQPRTHAVLLDGIRVLEIARRTWTTALCGRMLAANGADVIRIAFGEEGALALKRARPETEGGLHSNPSGFNIAQDARIAANARAGRRPNPQHLRGFDPTVHHTREAFDMGKPNTVPESLHAGKRLMPHYEGKEFVDIIRRELLPSCDVLLTDLTMQDLETLGLGFRGIRQDYPGLIFAHTSAIGISADGNQKGVEDAGAFFCLSGIAEELEHYLGPRGFAAATAASTFFGVICMSIMRRRCGGPGDRVDLSIYRSGKLCTALGALTGWQKGTQPQKAQPIQPSNVIQTPPVLPFDVLGAATVPIGRKPKGLPKGSHPRAPTDHHLTNGHTMPAMHAHPVFSWLSRDPSINVPYPQENHPITKENPLARVTVIEISDERNLSIVSLGSMLADLGAQVTKIERPKHKDPWARISPALYSELNLRKQKQNIDLPGTIEKTAALYRSFADTTMFITNLPFQALESWGLNIEKLRANFPHLIIVLITPWGCSVEARARELAENRKGGQEVPAFWEHSGLASKCFAGKTVPPGLAELAVAQHAIAGVGLGLLRQQRTGQGQLIHVGFYQAGLFSRFISESEAPAPGASPLLRTRDGRFMRLLGRGHKPHDIWVLLHATGRRPSLWDMFQGAADRVQEHLSAHTWAEVEQGQAELQEVAGKLMFDELAQAFRDKGVDWFCEEIRPVDAEALHRSRQGEAAQLKNQAEEAVRNLKYQVAEVTRLEQESMRADAQMQQQQLQNQQHETENIQILEGQLRGIEQEMQQLPLRVQELQRRYQELQQQPPPRNLQAAEFENVMQRQGRELQVVTKHLDAAQQRQRDLQEKRTALTYQLRNPSVLPAIMGRLQVRINSCSNLKNTDTGLMGDVSDPYVLVRVGFEEFTTKTIQDNLNPRWEVDNLFVFSIRDINADLELSVMNKNNVFSDDCIGRTRLSLRRLQNSAWQKFREKLLDGQNGLIDFDVCFEQTSSWANAIGNRDLQAQLLRAREEHDRISQEVKFLDQQVEMAEYATKWLQDISLNTAVPLSVGERAIQEAMGGRNFIIPTFVFSRREGEAPPPPVQRPHAVALFPELFDFKKPPKLRVKIISASGLPTLNRTAEVYVEVEVPGKDYFKTPATTVNLQKPDPEWDFTHTMKGWAVGDRLTFAVYVRSRPQYESRNQRSSTRTANEYDNYVRNQEQFDEILGHAELKSEHFYPDEFLASIPLHIYQPGNRGKLKVFVWAKEETDLNLSDARQ